MHPDSQAFHDKLAADKIIGRDSANEFIAKYGIDMAKRCASASVLSNEEAHKNYGYWCGWMDALQAHRG